MKKDKNEQKKEKEADENDDIRRLEHIKDNLDAPYEPLFTNRFKISSYGVEIPSYLFRKYKIFNDGEELIFTTEFYENVMFTLNPNDFFEITDFNIDFLDPVGEVISNMSFGVRKCNFSKSGTYSKCELSLIKLRYTIDIPTIRMSNQIK